MIEFYARFSQRRWILRNCSISVARKNYYNCELVERFSRFHTQLFLNSNPRERTARERAANTWIFFRMARIHIRNDTIEQCVEIHQQKNGNSNNDNDDEEFMNSAHSRTSVLHTHRGRMPVSERVNREPMHTHSTFRSYARSSIRFFSLFHRALSSSHTFRYSIIDLRLEYNN